MALPGGITMKVLVAVASRHGSTREIAQAIAQELQAAQFDVELRDAGEIESVEPYGAVVLDSAVYMSNWLAGARTFVEQHQVQLRAVPVWLFSSGPIGAEDPQPHGDPPKLPELLDATHARGHHIFVGRLDPHLLGFGER